TPPPSPPSFSHLPPPPALHPLPLHDALPICVPRQSAHRARTRGCDETDDSDRRRSSRTGLLRPAARLQQRAGHDARGRTNRARRSEEHTSELQSLTNLVCRLLLEKKKTKHHT